MRIHFLATSSEPSHHSGATLSFRTLRFPLLLALLLLGAQCLAAFTAPSGGTQLLGIADLAVAGSFSKGGTSTAPVAVRTLVPVSGQAFSQAAHIEVQNPNSTFYSSSVSANSVIAVQKDDVLLAHLWLRGISTTDETGSVFCTLYVQGPSPSYTKSLSQEVRAGSEWTEYWIPFTAAEAYAAGLFSANIGFGAGSRPQVLEVAGAEILWYGKSRTLADMPRTSFQYEGRNATASWRAAANLRIEQYRKSNYTVRVVNADGMPVAGAKVRVKLKRHAFPFGCAFESKYVYDQTKAAHKTYADKLTELFNSGSTGNDLKWGPWLGEWGPTWGWGIAKPALTLFKERGFLLRGHVLVWPSFRNLPNVMQTPLTNKDPAVPKMITDHIHDEVTTAKGLIDEWDVLNEPYDNHDVMDRFGNGVMIDWFKQARADHPGADLYVNDYAILSGGGNNVKKQDAYEATVRYLLDNGAPVTGMGFQGHFDGAPTGITKVLSIIDRYATSFPAMKFKITEFDVVTTDEALQADYTRDFLTACFSHPRITGFQFWGIWENDHWKPEAALYKADWTEKPNGAAYRTLVKNTWNTDDTKESAEDGRVEGRGFKGLYDVEVTYKGLVSTGTITIGDTQAQTDVVLAATLSTAPAFTRQPLGLTVAPGEAASLTCEVVGKPVPNLAWYRNGILLANTGSTLVIASASPADEGTYRIVATNSAGSATSRDFKLGVRTVERRTERLVNISTRGRVLDDQEKMVAGFVIDGDGSKKLLVRAVGPRLAKYGIAQTAKDPELRIDRIDVRGLVCTNDSWSADLLALFKSTWAFDLSDKDSTDSASAAVAVDLPRGLFTCEFTDKLKAGGIGIVEAYDASPNDGNKIVNISTRGFVGVDQANLVAGFCIQGEVPMRLLLRAVGKPLADYGITTPLSDPRFQLHEILPDGTPRAIGWSDDWCSSSQASALANAFTSTGAFAIPPFGNDAGMLVWLEPGAYTITVSGNNGATGVGIIEVYAAP